MSKQLTTTTTCSSAAWLITACIIRGATTSATTIAVIFRRVAATAQITLFRITFTIASTTGFLDRCLYNLAETLRNKDIEKNILTTL